MANVRSTMRNPSSGPEDASCSDMIFSIDYW
jgi:hypothetical protein